MAVASKLFVVLQVFGKQKKKQVELQNANKSVTSDTTNAKFLDMFNHMIIYKFRFEVYDTPFAKLVIFLRDKIKLLTATIQKRTGTIVLQALDKKFS